MPRLSNSQTGLTRQRSLLNAFRLKKQPVVPAKYLHISQPVLITPDYMDENAYSAHLSDPLRTPVASSEQSTFTPYMGPEDHATPPPPASCYSPPGLVDDDSCPESPESIYYRGHSRDASDLTAYWSSVRDEDEESVYSEIESDYVSIPEERESFIFETASIHSVERVQFKKATPVRAFYVTSEPAVLMV